MLSLPSDDLGLYVYEIDEILRKLDGELLPYSSFAIELSVKNDEEKTVSDGLATIDVQNKKGLSFSQYSALGFASLASAVVFLFGAEEAVGRYPYGHMQVFKWNSIVSAVITNWFFNWDAYIDYCEDDEKPKILRRLIAGFAAIAVMAPYFFLGFDGGLWQKILVVISTVFDIPVFYYGALSLYKFFNADFVQLWCAMLCLLPEISLSLIQKFGLLPTFKWQLDENNGRKKLISAENFLLALQKSFMLLSFKKQLDEFVYASKEERTIFINEFLACHDQEKIQFLVNRNEAVTQDNSLIALLTYMCCTPSGLLGLARWLFSSGTGILGLAVLAQTLAQAAVLVSKIMAMPIPFGAKVFLATILVIGNAIPNLGFSFITMARFDFINLFRSVFVCIPQRQRVLMSSACAAISLWVALLFFRYLYMASGFANDEINYEGALFLGANEKWATLAGISANITGAIIFNGVLNESLFKKMIGKSVHSKGDQEDKRQVFFEDVYEKVFDKFMMLPLRECKQMHFSMHCEKLYASFFQTKQKSTVLAYNVTPLQKSLVSKA